MNLRTLWATAQHWYATHSVRDRRIVLALAGALGVSLVYVGIVDPIVAYRQRVAQEIGEGQEQLERSARFIGALDTLRAEREELRQRLTQAKTRLLPGGSGTLGAAALQERANALATEKGIAIQSAQVMREEPADPFRKVAVRLTLMGELRQFTDFVAGFEYGPHQLTIPFVEVNRRGAVPGANGSVVVVHCGGSSRSNAPGPPQRSTTAMSHASLSIASCGRGPTDGHGATRSLPGRKP